MLLGERRIMKVEFKGKNITDLKKLPQQGFSNESYTFTLDKTTYLLRKFKLQDRDRNLEFRIQALAYKKGLAAKPLLLNLEDDYMICQYLEGSHKEKLKKNELLLLAEVLKTLHSINIQEQALDLKSEFSDLDGNLKDAFDIIEHAPKEMVLCHNDLNAKNCIFLNKDLKLIDWEFAGMNDRYFDLAAACVEFHLSTLDEAYFLARYFRTDGWEKKKLDAYKVVYKALCKQWFEDNI